MGPPDLATSRKTRPKRFLTSVAGRYLIGIFSPVSHFDWLIYSTPVTGMNQARPKLQMDFHDRQRTQLAIDFTQTNSHLFRSHALIKSLGVWVGYDFQYLTLHFAAARQRMFEQRASDPLPHISRQNPEMLEVDALLREDQRIEARDLTIRLRDPHVRAGDEFGRDGKKRSPDFHPAF